MLIPDTLFFWIMQNRGVMGFPIINKRSVTHKRVWKKKFSDSKNRENFSKMRSEVQTRVMTENPDLKKKFHKGTSKAKKEYWDNISEEDKKAHIEKMSKGMKKAWDESDENFGPRVAQVENHKILNGNVEYEDNLPRINDYCGVITQSQLAELDG